MDIATVEDRLQRILDSREALIPEVRDAIARIDSVENDLGHVRNAAADLPAAMQDDPGIFDAVSRLLDSEFVVGLRNARGALTSVDGRFSRKTINIGVTGRARVGKSTVLQSVSGLTDDQVPTGDSLNVTAVRSRIFHSQETLARIEFYTTDSFLRDVVQPYFSDSDLDLGPAPQSLDAFARFNPPANKALSIAAGEKLRRLTEIQNVLPNLRHLLNSPPLVLNDLSGLREYVAYPTPDEELAEAQGRRTLDRKYLAVRDCRIEAPFPHSGVSRLGIVDLPGLGEQASGIEERIVLALSEQVDFVIFVLRASPNTATLNNNDDNVADLIDKARGPIEHTQDFAWVLLNGSAEDSNRIQALKTAVLRRLNGDKEDSRYFSVVADARSAESIHKNVLMPALIQLSERLPIMDRQILRSAVEQGRSPLEGIQAAARKLQSSLGKAQTQTGSNREKLDYLAQDLREDVQHDLGQLHPERLSDEYVERYLAKLDEVHDAIKESLHDGLLLRHGTDEVSRQNWIKVADGRRGVAQSYRPFAISELHRLRVYVIGEYAGLDEFLNSVLVEDFYGTVCDALAGDESQRKSNATFGSLLGQREAKGSQRLRTLLSNLSEAGDVGGLTRAVDRLSGITFDFRLQSYPVLHDMSLNLRPVDGENPVPPDFESSALLYEWFSNEIVKFSNRIRYELAQDATRQFKVLSGAAVVFEDEIVRSGTSGREFRNLADDFRDELWPTVFKDMNPDNVRGRELASALRNLQTSLTKALGGSND